MIYRIYNKTNFPKEKIKEIIDFVCPKYVCDFSIKIKYKNNSNTSGWVIEPERKILIYLESEKSFPRRCHEKFLEKYGYIDRTMIKNREEYLVSIIAHELRHLWQYYFSRRNFERYLPKHVPGIDENRYELFYAAEKDSSMYSRRMVLKWRAREKK